MGLFDMNKRIHYPAMDARKLKEGKLLKYKSGFLGGKWKNVHAVLYSDSTFTWYDEKGESKPSGSILLKDVVPYMCVGLMTDRMPTRRPSLPSGTSVHHVVGIGMDPRAEKVHWFLFGSDSDLESWFQEIVKTLPKPNPPPQSQDGQKIGDGASPPPVGFNVNPGQPAPPPPYNSGGSGGYPPPAGNSGPYPQGGYRPPPPQGYGQPQGYGGYPQSNTHTVIIDRTGGGSGYGGGSGFGGGSGLGMGLLGGALLGYGLGSVFSGPHGWGGYGGFGGGFGGHGFGGGYYSDNDTTINNYYNTTNDNTTTNNYDNQDNNGGYNDGNAGGYDQYQDQPYDQDQGVDYNDFGNDGGYDGGYDGGDYGGGDFGGGDFGGGDFGGGDFGGGDFGDF